MGWDFSISHGFVLSPFLLAVLGRIGGSFSVCPLGPFLSLFAKTPLLGGSGWRLPFPLYDVGGETWGGLPSCCFGSLDLFLKILDYTYVGVLFA